MARRPYLRNSAIAGAILSTASLVGSAFAQGAIDLDQLTMIKAATELCAGKITSKALTAAALARAKANPNLNAQVGDGNE